MGTTEEIKRAFNQGYNLQKSNPNLVNFILNGIEKGTNFEIGFRAGKNERTKEIVQNIEQRIQNEKQRQNLSKSPIDKNKGIEK